MFEVLWGLFRNYWEVFGNLLGFFPELYGNFFELFSTFVWIFLNTLNSYYFLWGGIHFSELYIPFKALERFSKVF